jgi:hypothetical protein
MPINYGQKKKTNTVFGGSDGIRLPTGGTGDRATSPTDGSLRYNSDDGNLEQYSSSTWSAITSPPIVTGLSGYIDTDTDTTIDVTGDKFEAGSTIIIEGPAVSNVARTLTTTFTSANELSANTNASSVNYVANAGFDIRVDTPGKSTSRLINAGTVNSPQTWSTPSGQLASVANTVGDYFPIATVTAVDANNDTIEYTVTSGALPDGVVLDRYTGQIFGRPTVIVSGATSYSFTVTAATLRDSISRSFSIEITPDLPEVSSVSTSGANNTNSSTATANELLRHGAISGSRKTLTISGANFFGGETVTLGGLNCTNVSVVSDTQITCTTPTGTMSAGSVDLVVSNNAGSATLSGAITTRSLGSSSNFPAQDATQIAEYGDHGGTAGLGNTGTSGAYWLDPAGFRNSVNTNPQQVYCDMQTQGGGWTLCGYWDRDVGGDAGMGTNGFNSYVNFSNLSSLDPSGNRYDTLNVRDMVANGNYVLMHVSKNSSPWTNSWDLGPIFSTIFTTIRSNPDRLWDGTYDTRSSRSGTVSNLNSGTAVQDGAEWYRSIQENASSWTVDPYSGDDTSTGYNGWPGTGTQTALQYFIRDNSGEGRGQWSNGAREGAVYTSGADSNCGGHGSPKVQWGWRDGSDNSPQSYGHGSYCIGTQCPTAPRFRMNYMFIRRQSTP